MPIKPVEIEGMAELPPFCHYTDFNYVETPHSIFLIWPKIHDNLKELLVSFAGLNKNITKIS